MKALILGWLIFLSFTAGAALYKVVDENGKVTYTDRPVAGAQRVDLSGVNTAVMPSIAPQVNKSAPKKVQRPLPEYNLHMTMPADGATLRDNLGRVNVAGEIAPAGAGVFQLLLDGEVVDTQPAPRFSLENVDRGEHTLQIAFLHNSGKILASSDTRTIYLHRASALINPGQ